MSLLRRVLSYAAVSAVCACGGTENPSAPNAEAASVRAPETTSDRKIVETYDLVKIGGQALPLTYSGGGSTWQVTGGRYELMSDGTYFFYYVGTPWGGRKPGPDGWFVRTDRGTIEFYYAGSIGPFYAERNRHFASGRLTDAGMVVDYEDTVDFEQEIYLKR